MLCDCTIADLLLEHWEHHGGAQQQPAILPRLAFPEFILDALARFADTPASAPLPLRRLCRPARRRLVL